ncbi:MAG TPA: glycosyltransferase family 2 protein [Bryobacteraceae bacterium]|nr:glycosyltransferase family 2 protein [Bryobacteraceae bacterium]
MIPKISVAIATYNRAEMVREAVMAALRQSLAPDEIVVADDASTDRTVEGLLALGDARVRVLRRESNSGGVENWNSAMRAASGEFLAWCSDDDRFAPYHLEASVAFLEKHAEIGMVHSGFIDAIEAGGRVEMVERRLRSAQPIIIDRERLARYMMRYYNWPFHPSTLVMRREVWLRTGEFDPRYALADTDWFVRAAQQFKIALLARHGVINRRHAGNWSNRVGSAAMQREIFEVVERGILNPLWRLAWRLNVKARLAWTVRMRIEGGHAEAACAAWSVLARQTGWRLPRFAERWGLQWIRRRGAGKTATLDARERVSPL